MLKQVWIRADLGWRRKIRRVTAAAMEEIVVATATAAVAATAVETDETADLPQTATAMIEDRLEDLMTRVC